MNKREFMEAAWVHISKRIPQDIDAEFVLTYNSRNGYMYCFQASWARTYAKLMLENRGDELSWDRQFTHWMPLYGPQNGITYAEYCSKHNRKAK